MKIQLSHSEALAMKGLVDRLKKTDAVKVDISLTHTNIDIESKFVAEVLLAIKNLSKEWKK